VDALSEQHPAWSPYAYVLGNPLKLVDPDGRQVNATLGLPRVVSFKEATSTLQIISAVLVTVAENIGGPVYEAQAPGLTGPQSIDFETQAYEQAFGQAAPYVMAGSAIAGAIRGNIRSLTKNADDIASAGKRVFDDLADGQNLSTNDALSRAVDFLGEGARETRAGSGIFISADNTRRVRMTSSDLTGHGGKTKPHLNFETGKIIKDKKGRNIFDVEENKHIFLPEEK
jgi:hypothetical protein